MSHIFSAEILRHYDIRGTYGRNLHVGDALALGYCLGEIGFERGLTRAVVGKDARASSDPLYEALCEALQDCGLEVIGVGYCATPELYFADQYLEAGIAVMVTGSHNPVDDNGFKIIVGSKPFFGIDIEGLQSRAKSSKQSRAGGSIVHESIRPFYIERLLQEFGNLPDLRVAFDPANGALCWALESLCKHFPNCVVINGTADGSFPSHHADPIIAENLVDLQEVVLRENCDFGIGFDGDGDRLGVVDDMGEILWGDSLIPLYADAILRQRPGAVILADVKAGGSVFNMIEQLGGVAIMTPSGHSIIKQRISESGALLAGEMSGHMFFADNYYGFDDGLYAALRLWQAVGDSRKKLSELRLRYPIDIAVQEIRLKVDEARKFSLMAEIKAYAEAHYDDIILVDGVRVSFATESGQGWWLVRAANTENALSLRAAGSDDHSLRISVKKLDEVLTHFNLACDEVKQAL